jgi:glutamate--cysteine ligase
MSTKTEETTLGPTIESKAQLVEYLEKGSKPKAKWRIGTEHEKFGFRRADKSPIGYGGPDGIAAAFERLQQFGWKPIYEKEPISGKENVIALAFDGQTISLEPGGQLELSGAPLENLHQTCRETSTHLRQVMSVADELDIGFLGLGFTPLAKITDMPHMPKDRYRIMRSYMPKKGHLGLEMMYRTSTVQVNLDFSSEADMVKKFRVGLALQPVVTALFANSPFTEGKPNGSLSYRSHIWTDTDPDRCGMLPFVFEDGMSFERYVDYALDVPMYFVYRNGYIDASGQSFRDFMKGRLPAFPGQYPTMSDWADHLTTLFPEVRLKHFLEMRGADGGPWGRLCALPALFVGLLYDGTALDAAWDLVKDWSIEDHDHLRANVPARALKVPFKGGTMRDIAVEMLKIARHGLERRAVRDGSGETETRFLAELEEIALSGRTPAEELLEKYNGPWNKSVLPVFDEYGY